MLLMAAAVGIKSVDRFRPTDKCVCMSYTDVSEFELAVRQCESAFVAKFPRSRYVVIDIQILKKGDVGYIGMACGNAWNPGAPLLETARFLRWRLKLIQ